LVNVRDGGGGRERERERNKREKIAKKKLETK
jgi:hypothetical protein